MGLKHDLIDHSNLPLFLDFAVLTSEGPYKEETAVGRQCVKGDLTSLFPRLEIGYQGIRVGQPQAWQLWRNAVVICSGREWVAGLFTLHALSVTQQN